MAWNEDRATKRIAEKDYQDFEINVQDLKRSMDFHKLGAKDVRRAQGVHFYVDMPGFHSTVEAAGNDKQKQRKLVRAASTLRKVQRDLLEADDIGDIQRQTVRLHGLVFKPYDKHEVSHAAKRAEHAVKHAITHNTYVQDVFKGVFEEPNFDCAVGLDCGTSYIANTGPTGMRELISLGSCANVAAKILDVADTITVTKAIYDDLPESLKKVFEKGRVVSGNQTYTAKSVRWSNHPQLAADLGVVWNEAKWRKKTEEYRDGLALSEINISDATVRIDVHSLTEKECKRTDAITFYADLAGFTRYVHEAENDDKVVSLVRMFHMIRAEFHAVFESDYEAIVLQHRGDCILAINHLPSGGDNRVSRCDEAVNIAIGLQSSMEHALNEHLTDYEDIHLAIGMDVGGAFVTRLGKKGQRISICFGPEVSTAEAYQTKTGPKRIRISKAIFDSLTEPDIKSEFKTDGDTFVAYDLTFPNLEEKKDAEAAAAGNLGTNIVSGKPTLSQSSSSGRSKPWSKD